MPDVILEGVVEMQGKYKPKTHAFTVRVDLETAQTIKAHCLQRKITVSDYLREVIGKCGGCGCKG